MTHRRTLGFTRRAALAAALLLSIGACDPAAEGIFVAESENVMIAVVAADDLVTAYACDGSFDYLGVSAWFHGQLRRGAGTLTNADGATLVLDIKGDQFTAEVRGDTVTNGPYKLSGALATSDEAGLYWGEADGWLGGWILAESGEQRGAVFKRNTGDVSLVDIQPAATSVTLEDQTVMPIQRMTAPTKVE